MSESQDELNIAAVVKSGSGLVMKCAIAEVFGDQEDKDRTNKALDDWQETLPRVLSGVNNAN